MVEYFESKETESVMSGFIGFYYLVSNITIGSPAVMKRCSYCNYTSRSCSDCLQPATSITGIFTAYYSASINNLKILEISLQLQLK